MARRRRPAANSPFIQWQCDRPDQHSLSAGVNRGLLHRPGADEFFQCAASINGADEFGEDGREPVLWVDVHAEFVVAASQVLTNACPALTARAERSRFRPRIGRSRALRHP